VGERQISSCLALRALGFFLGLCCFVGFGFEGLLGFRFVGLGLEGLCILLCIQGLCKFQCAWFDQVGLDCEQY
jgi:hypothetical protein